MAKSTSKAPTSNIPKVLEEKWSPEVIEAGWAAIPSAMIEHQRALGLDPIDINIILHLANRWWVKENRPTPSKGSIAEAMKIDVSTVRRRIQNLEKAKLVRRQERRISKRGSLTNVYHLDGLIEALKPFAKVMVAEKKKRVAEREARYAQKSPPKLSLAGGTEVDFDDLD